jgi:hypothetical protein
MRLKPHALVLLTALTSASAAHAAFYVNEDAPAPTITASNPLPLPARPDTTEYVEFHGVYMTHDGKDTLQGLLGKVQNASSITLTATTRSHAQLTTTRKRLATVKNWLVRNGVTAGSIQASTELDPQDDPSDTDVQIVVHNGGNNAPPLLPRSIPLADNQPAILSAPTTSSNTANGGMTDEMRLQIARRLMAMAQNKIISQEDAVRLVNDFLTANPATAAMPASAIPGQQISAQGEPQISVAAPAVAEVPRTWTLVAGRSLQENIQDWAKDAGYAAPDWKASMPYQVNYSSPYVGTFLQVLQQVNAQVPSLDFLVSQSRHTLTVVDSKH